MTRQDEHRAVAIQCVAELALGVQILDVEVCRGAGRKDVRTTINQLRHLLRTLDDAVMRDGRWAHWAKPEADQVTAVTIARIEGTARSILIEAPLHTPRPALGELVAGLVSIARRHPHTAPMVESILARTAASIDPEGPS